MKNVKIVPVLLSLLLIVQLSIAQEAARPAFVVVSTAHWNLEYDNPDTNVNWLELEKDYHDKVIMKNELIISAGVLNHMYTADNTEILFFTTYASWEDIEKAGERNGELIEAAWPDEAVRDSLGKLRNEFYTNHHSDEIYATVPGAKIMTEASEDPLVYYVRVSEMAFPEDGSGKEWNDFREMRTAEIYNKNELIKGYYPNMHAWGADGTDYLEVFVYDSLSDLDASAERETELWDAAFPPDSEKRQELMDKKIGRYTTGKHRDYIYSSVPELMK